MDVTGSRTATPGRCCPACGGLLTRAAQTTARGSPQPAGLRRAAGHTVGARQGAGVSVGGAAPGRAPRMVGPGRWGELSLTCSDSTHSALLFSLIQATQGSTELGLASPQLHVSVTGAVHSLGHSHCLIEVFIWLQNKCSFKVCGQPVCRGNFASRQPKRLLKRRRIIVSRGLCSILRYQERGFTDFPSPQP